MRPVALITGGSRNIGWSIAQRFAPTHRVVVGDIAAPVGPLSEGIAWFECDVRDYAACERLVAAATTGGPLAVLIHSAAITRPPVPMSELSASEWAEVIDVNLTGAFHVARAALEPLKAAKGSAVLISSRAARVGYAALAPSPGGTKPHYCAAKAGVISLARSLAVELAPHGVRVNCVAPGFTSTPAAAHHVTDERRRATANSVPLGRVAVADEMADAVVFLASDFASFVSGQTLVFDGGLLCTTLRAPRGWRDLGGGR